MISDREIELWAEKTGHSLFGPSGLKRVMLCPASAQETIKAPVPESSPYAEEGTRLHSMAEEALREGGLKALEWINYQDWSDEDKAVLLDAVGYVLKVAETHDQRTFEIRVETDGSLTHWGMPMVTGTVDVILSSSSRLDVLDYKFGKGVSVFAQRNPQLLAYTLMNLASLDTMPPNSYVHIVQPYLDNYSVDTIDRAVLEDFLKDLTYALTAAWSEDPEYNPTQEACRWCNGKWGCEARKDNANNMSRMLINASKNMHQIDKTNWSKLLTMAEDIGQVLKQLRAYAHNEIESGRGFPGFKLVAGRSNRVFTDSVAGADYIREKLGSRAVKPADVISLAQAEKLLPSLKKDEVWKGLISKFPGKPMLVPEDDPRDALQFGAALLFGSLAEDFSDDNL